MRSGRGDKGMTSLVGGYRVSKTHPRLEAFGTVDELNAFIGLLMTEIKAVETRELFVFIQSKLFTVGAYLATDPSKTDVQMENGITGDCIERIEEAIQQIDATLPKMNAFVIPGGSRSAAIAHVCRTVCRRAERAIFHLSETEEIEANVFILMNRLSDFLFVISRDECQKNKNEEKFWDNTCK